MTNLQAYGIASNAYKDQKPTEMFRDRKPQRCASLWTFHSTKYSSPWENDQNSCRSQECADLSWKCFYQSCSVSSRSFHKWTLLKITSRSQSLTGSYHDVWLTISWSLSSALGPHGLCEFILFPVSQWCFSLTDFPLSPLSSSLHEYGNELFRKKSHHIWGGH